MPGRGDLRRRYRVSAPVATHFEPYTAADVATGRACAGVDCPEYLRGWKLRYDVLTDQQRYDVDHCGRHFTVDDGWAIFEAGQPCFRAPAHLRRLDREAVFRMKDGLALPTTFRSPEAWRDDLHEHTDRIEQTRQKG